MNIFRKIINIKEIATRPSEGQLNTFVNPYSYLQLRNQGKLLENFDNIYLDGFLLVFFFRLVGVRTNRNSFDMTSLAPKVLQGCIKGNKSIYFIGSTEKAINSFVKVISKDFPKLDIVGHRNGYFNNVNEKENTLKAIIHLKPSVVVVGMGTPFQEQFLVDLKNTGWVGIGYTCGGFIHQTANGINYYPEFFNKYNLRWLYRIMDEPKLIKRYFILYPNALLMFIWDLVLYKLSK